MHPEDVLDRLREIHTSIYLTLSIIVNICILPLLLPLFLCLGEVGSAAGDVWLE